MTEYGLIHDATKLRKFIAENPDLPIVVCAGEEANGGDWSWVYCASVDCNITEILDIKTPYDRDDGIIFDDKGDFEEAVADVLADRESFKNMSNTEFDEAVKREAAMYDGCWRKVIAVYVTN